MNTALSSPLLFGLPRLVTSYVNVSVVTLALPMIVIEVARPEAKGFHLGLITAAAALASIAVLYTVGTYSDKHRARQGRRRYPLYGLALFLVPLAALFLGGPYPLLVAAIIGLVVARSVTEGSHLPLLVDYDGFGATHKYTASIAFYQVLGAGGGALMFSYFDARSFNGANVASLPAAVGILVVIVAMLGYRKSVRRLPRIRAGTVPAEELRGDGAAAGPMAIPMAIPPAIPPAEPPEFQLSRELRLLLLARLFFLAGILIVSTYLVFVVADVMKAHDVSRTAGGLFATAVVGGLLFALPSRRLTERLGETRTLLLAGAVLAVAAALFVLAGGQFPWVARVSMVLYGAGFTTVVSAGLSLTVKLITRPELAGRIMAIVIASTFASQFLASVIGTALLDPLNRLADNAGYYGLLAATEMCFALGALFLLRLASTRKRPVVARR